MQIVYSFVFKLNWPVIALFQVECMTSKVI